MLEQIAKRARRVPWPLRTVILGPPLLASIGATFFFMVTDSGPWAFLADLQASGAGGSYSPKLNFLCLWLGFILAFVAPAGVLVQLLAFMFPERGEG